MDIHKKVRFHLMRVHRSKNKILKSLLPDNIPLTEMARRAECKTNPDRSTETYYFDGKPVVTFWKPVIKDNKVKFKYMVHNNA